MRTWATVSFALTVVASCSLDTEGTQSAFGVGGAGGAAGLGLEGSAGAPTAGPGGGGLAGGGAAQAGGAGLSGEGGGSGADGDAGGGQGGAAGDDGAAGATAGTAGMAGVAGAAGNQPGAGGMGGAGNAGQAGVSGAAGHGGQAPANLVLDLDANDVHVKTGRVTEWPDHSVFRNDASPANLSNAPAYGSTALDGKRPAVVFSLGPEAYLEAKGTLGSLSQMTACVVTARIGQASRYEALLAWGADKFLQPNFFFDKDAQHPGAQFGTTIVKFGDLALPPSKAFVLCFGLGPDPTGGTKYLVGASLNQQISSNALPPFPPPSPLLGLPLRIGADADAGDALSASVAEIVVYDRLLSPGEGAPIVTNLMQKWGIAP